MGNLRSERGRAFKATLSCLLAAAGVSGCGDSPEASETDVDAGAVEQLDAGGDSDASACECSARWEIDNLVPCWEEPTDDTPPTPYSSHLDAEGLPACEPYLGVFPHPTPSTPWSTQRASSSCTGSAELCLVIKQGDPKAPAADDCVLATLCDQVRYEDVEATMELPPLPGWAAQDEQCARDFYEQGGYFEMVARDYAWGGCKSGDELVLGRVPFCPVRCSLDPNLPECAQCGDGTAVIEF